MATYTPINNRELDTILSQYDLGALDTIKPLKGGQANSSFKLDTRNGRFVLSICDEKPLQEVRILTLVLQALEAHNFPTTRVIRTADGRSVIELDGKPVFIKTYIEGEVPRKTDTTMIYQVGQQLAGLHRIPVLSGVPRGFAYGWDHFTEVIDSTADDRYRHWLAAKKDYLQPVVGSDLPQSMVHGDLFYDNTLFEGDRLVAILDFEEVCVYHRAFDIGMCLVGFCTPEHTVSLAKFRALVAGYQSRIPLTQAEKRHLQALAVLGATATSFWRFRQYNMLYPNSSLGKSYVGMNQLADQLQAFPEDEFQAAVF